jgi:cytochrome c
MLQGYVESAEIRTNDASVAHMLQRESVHLATILRVPSPSSTPEANMMKRLNGRRAVPLAALSFAAATLALSGHALGADAAAAQALARQNNCFKCHAVDKKKEGPAWKEVAAKLKSDKDAEAILTKHLTTGPKVKFEDGHTEDHPILKSKSPEETKNLVSWILSL